jgi:hypothetical protein
LSALFIGLTLNAAEENELFSKCVHAAHLVNRSQLTVMWLRKEIQRGVSNKEWKRGYKGNNYRALTEITVVVLLSPCISLQRLIKVWKERQTYASS